MATRRRRQPRPLSVRTIAEREIRAGRVIQLDLETTAEHVPGILSPPHGEPPFPAVLLLHGFSSRKERMADSVGRALLARGIASLALDLPLHGGRTGSVEELSHGNPLRLIGVWRLAIAEARQSLRALESDMEVDPARIGIIGYSLGAYLGLMVAAEEPGVRAVVLAAGGDLPDRMPLAPLVRSVADPLRAARRLAGRPLLMINGTRDRRIPPAQAKRLFDAASEPKEMVWYEGPHWPPGHTMETAARWLENRGLGARDRGLGVGG